jgi:large subunit ribosomal protein L29
VKTAELREKTDEDLVELEKTMARDLWKARFANHSNQLDDTNKVRRTRRDIARIKTLQGERSSAAANNGPTKSGTPATDKK